MLIAGALGGALALTAAFFTQVAGHSQAVAFVLFAGLTMVPATILWLSRNVYLRGGAVGLAATFVTATFVVLVWHPWTTMDAQEIERAESEAQASGHPTFYLGHTAAGYQLNDHYLGADQANFFYGECHPEPEPSEGGCVTWDVAIYTTWEDVTIGGDAIAGCLRLEPVAGIPTVYLRYGTRTSDIALFTGDSQITIEVEGASNLEDKLRVVQGVQQVGAEPATTLPPPQPHILAYLERHCASTS